LKAHVQLAKLKALNVNLSVKLSMNLLNARHSFSRRFPLLSTISNRNPDEPSGRQTSRLTLNPYPLSTGNQSPNQFAFYASQISIAIKNSSPISR
jgi:hypothetical protein